MYFDNCIEKILTIHTRGRHPSSELVSDLEEKIYRCITSKIKKIPVKTLVTISLNMICEPSFEYSSDFTNFIKDKYPEYLV